MESFALHVLVVAGSPQKRRALRRLLAQGTPDACAIAEADRADLALSHCRADPPDCVLLAIPLPDQDVRRFLADLRAKSGVPVVLLTDVGHEAVAVDALQHGAQDYLLTASLTPLRLRLTIQRAIAGARYEHKCDHSPALRADLLDTLPVGVGGTRDITEDKQAEEALHDTRRKLSTLFELLPVGVSIFDAVGSLVYVNPALEQILRMDRADLIQGRHLARPYFRPDGTSRPLDELVRHRVFRERQAIMNQVNGFLSEAGEAVWTYVSGVPVDFPDWKAVLITADITAQRQAQGALATHAEALSRTNAELTRVLQLKDEFLAMMSHELRTPLSVVLGVTEALEEELYGPISDQQRQALGNVAQSARQLLAILSDILDLAHLEAGKGTLDMGAVDVDLLCQIALQLIQAPAQAKGIQLLCTVEAGIAGLRADERRLTQILTNLLDNAVKFTPQGGTVGLEVTADASEERIQFVVWDTGIGIAEAGYARLFQPFTQLDGRLSREYGGIGLGLTLVRQLVDMHGGSVSLESTPGQGSRFTVRLPWAPEENVVRTTIREPAPPPRSWAHPPTLLIADDHELTLQFYAELLRKQGCQVALARTGTEAVAQVRATRPEVAILDIQMPDLDGLSAIRQIRADPEVGATPIIALTALAMPGDRERCLAAGASDYLAKPIGTRALVAAIAEALSGSQTEG